MVNSEDLARDAVIDLVLFEARMSPDGRLLHYARARLRTVGLRQTFTCFGSLVVLVSVGFVMFKRTRAMEVMRGTA